MGVGVDAAGEGMLIRSHARRTAPWLTRASIGPSLRGRSALSQISCANGSTATITFRYVGAMGGSVPWVRRCHGSVGAMIGSVPWVGRCHGWVGAMSRRESRHPTSTITKAYTAVASTASVLSYQYPAALARTGPPSRAGPCFPVVLFETLQRRQRRYRRRQRVRVVGSQFDPRGVVHHARAVH